MIRRNITKTFTLCLLSIAIIGCNQRKGNDTYTVKGNRIEASASAGRADSTKRVANTRNTGVSNSLAAQESNKKKTVNKQLADLKRRTISKYFANCDSDESRCKMTIKASLDKGMTWNEADKVMLDEDIGSGYPSMTMVDRETVGIFYEGTVANLVFQRIKLKDLVNSKR